MPIALSPMIEGLTPVGTLRYMVSLMAGAPVEEERATVPRRRPDHPARAGRRRRRDRAVELPADAGLVQVRARRWPLDARSCSSPRPETVLDSYVFAEAVMAAGIPPGVINIVPGGRELGAYLVQHRDVDKIAFTGSTAAGRRIAAVCGQPPCAGARWSWAVSQPRSCCDDADLECPGTGGACPHRVVQRRRAGLPSRRGPAPGPPPPVPGGGRRAGGRLAAGLRVGDPCDAATARAAGIGGHLTRVAGYSTPA